MPDLDAYAREFYNEIRALSMDTGGSIENILDNIGASCESLTSLIPQEKRQELANFEMSLKQMIDEAKQLAESRAASRVSLAASQVSLAASVSLDNLPGQEPEQEAVRWAERSRSRKSESVVSVIEATPPCEEVEPVPLSQRGAPMRVSQSRQDSLEEQPPPPPLEEMDPPAAPARSPAKISPQPAAPTRATGRTAGPTRRGPAVNREPSVGSDRYEEIITETRRRSQSRSRLGSRASSTLDFRTSQASLGQASLGRAAAALDLETPRPRPGPATPELTRKPLAQAPPACPATAAPELAKKTAPPSTIVAPARPAPPPVKLEGPLVAMDGNGNALAPSLPVVPAPPARPASPDPLVQLFPKNIPDWFLITYTYSVVLVAILLIANLTPDGKLYIHFTAFWSLILYFLLEDDQVSASPKCCQYYTLLCRSQPTSWTLWWKVS